MRDLAEGFGQALDSICAIPSPAIAAKNHDELIKVYGAITLLGESWDLNAMTLVFALEFFGRMEQFAQITDTGHQLVARALRDHDDPLSAYLFALSDARLAELESAIVLGLFRAFSSPLAGELSDLEDLDASLQALERRVRDLQPPSEARELHQRQLELIATQIEQAQRTHDVRSMFVAAEGEAELRDAHQANVEAGKLTGELLARQSSFSEAWYPLALAALEG